MNASEPTAPRCADCGGPLLGGMCAVCTFRWMQGEAEVSEAAPRVGRYELLECLARGGMGVVYAARDTELHRMVALKVLRGAAFAGPAEVARFTLETKAAAALDHPHIVPVYEVGMEDGEPFYTMKLIDGETLAERLRREGPLPPREAAALLVPVVRAVAHAHQYGVLHRDLKPANILLDRAGRPWLTDFGLAKFSAADSGLTRSTDTLGTPHYMSPEMAEGRAHEFTAASDVWALGAMLWEMMAGAPPYRGQSVVEILQAVAKDGLPPPPEAMRQHRDVCTITQRCLEKRPADRIASASILADELERFLRGEPVHSRPAAPLERLGKWAARRPLHAALLGLGLLFLAVSALLWLRAEKANTALSGSNADLAESNARLAESLQRATATRLAGEARLLMEENPDRALLLAAAAAEMTAGGQPQPDAVAALFEVMQRAGGRDCTPVPADVDHPGELMPGAPEFEHAGQISPDGRWLVVVTAPEFYLGTRPLVAALYDLHAAERTAPVRRWSLTDSGTRAPFAPLIGWLRDSRRFLLVEGTAAVLLVDPLAGLEGTASAAAPVMTEPPPSRLLGVLTPPADLDAPVLCGVRIAALPEEGGSALLGLCWRAGERSTLQAWSARPEGLVLVRAFPIPLPVGEDPVCTLSPQGRWLAFAVRTWMPLAPEGTSALLFDLQQPDLPPRRILTDAAAAAAQPERSVDDLASSHLLPEFGSVHGAEDVMVVPHPGHGLQVHRLAGTQPGEGIPGRALPVLPSRLRAYALAPDCCTLAESRQAHGVVVHTLVWHSGDFSAGEPVVLPGTEDGGVIGFSADSRWLAAAQKNEVHLWQRDELHEGQPPRRLLGCATRIGRISFSRDSRTLFTAGGSWLLRRWNFDGGTAGLNPRQISVPGSAVREVALSPDGEWIAAATDGSGQLQPELSSAQGWVAAGRLTGSRLAPLAPHGSTATGVAFSPCGKWLAGAGGTKIRAWNFSELAGALDAGRPVPERAFSFASGSMLPQYDARLAWFPGEKLYCVHGGGGDLFWDFTSADPLSTTLGSPVSSILYQLPAVAISPDRRFKAIARHGWDKAAAPSDPGTDEPAFAAQHGNQVLLFHGEFARQHEFIEALAANFLGRTNLAISRDGRWLAAGGAGKPATLWDLHSADISASRREAPVSAALSAAVAFSPDSTRLAIGTGSETGSGPGTLNFWDFLSGDAAGTVLTIRTPRGIGSLVWHPDGRLISGGGGSSVSVWQTDPALLIRMARAAAGRELTGNERARHGL